MAKDRPATTAALIRPAEGIHGRDGAVDYAVKTDVLGAASSPEPVAVCGA